MGWPFKKEQREEVPEEKRQELFAKVRDALIKDFHIPEEKITFEARFREDFGFDSVDTVQANIDLEEAFNLVIPDEDINKILTIDDLIVYLYFRLQEKKD